MWTLWLSNKMYSILFYSIFGVRFCTSGFWNLVFSITGSIRCSISICITHEENEFKHRPLPLLLFAMNIITHFYTILFLYEIFMMYIIGTVVFVTVWELDLQLPVQSVTITTKVCDEVCQWLETGRWISSGANKTERHDTSENP